MNKKVEELQMFIANGQLKEAFENFFNHLSEFRQNAPNSQEEIKGIRKELLLLSGNFTDINKNYAQGILPLIDFNLTKNRIRKAFLDILDILATDYPQFFCYLEEIEEEEAWALVTEKNTIAAYETYFKNYPKGKYIDETEKIISELKNELKIKALEEKERRKIFQHKNQDYHKKDSSESTNKKLIQSSSDWWNGISKPWKLALMYEIGCVGKPTEQHLRRILKLKVIDLSNNTKIQTLLPLEHLRSLKTLNLSNTNLTSLKGVETLLNIEKLDISYSNIRDLSPLMELKKLHTLIYSNVSTKSLMAFRARNANCKLFEKY